MAVMEAILLLAMLLIQVVMMVLGGMACLVAAYLWQTTCRTWREVLSKLLCEVSCQLLRLALWVDPFPPGADPDDSPPDSDGDSNPGEDMSLGSGAPPPPLLPPPPPAAKLAMKSSAPPRALTPKPCLRNKECNRIA